MTKRRAKKGKNSSWHFIITFGLNDTVIPEQNDSRIAESCYQFVKTAASKILCQSNVAKMPDLIEP